MSKKLKKLEKIVEKENKILRKLFKASKIKVNRKRVSLYDKENRCIGWILRKDFNKLKREKAFSLRKTRDKKFFRVKQNAIIYQKRVHFKISDDLTVKKHVRIKTYTKNQRKYLKELIKERKLPLPENFHKKSKLMRISLLKKLREANFIVRLRSLS